MPKHGNTVWKEDDGRDDEQIVEPLLKSNDNVVDRTLTINNDDITTQTTDHAIAYGTIEGAEPKSMFGKYITCDEAIEYMG